jgi:predicted DNA-binding transcriptional regulator AlpA
VVRQYRLEQPAPSSYNWELNVTNTPEPPILAECFRVEGAAAYTGLSVHTLNQMRGTLDGPPFVKLPRAVLYRKSDLDAWLEQRVRRSTFDDRKPEQTGAEG